MLARTRVFAGTRRDRKGGVRYTWPQRDWWIRHSRIRYSSDVEDEIAGDIVKHDIQERAPRRKRQVQLDEYVVDDGCVQTGTRRQRCDYRRDRVCRNHVVAHCRIHERNAAVWRKRRRRVIVKGDVDYPRGDLKSEPRKRLEYWRIGRQTEVCRTGKRRRKRRQQRAAIVACDDVAQGIIDVRVATDTLAVRRGFAL